MVRLVLTLVPLNLTLKTTVGNAECALSLNASSIIGTYYTAVPQQKDPSDKAPLSLFQLYHLHTKHEFE